LIDPRTGRDPFDPSPVVFDPPAPTGPPAPVVPDYNALLQILEAQDAPSPPAPQASSGFSLAQLAALNSILNPPQQTQQAQPTQPPQPSQQIAAQTPAAQAATAPDYADIARSNYLAQLSNQVAGNDSAMLSLLARLSDDMDYGSSRRRADDPWLAYRPETDPYRRYVMALSQV